MQISHRIKMLLSKNDSFSTIDVIIALFIGLIAFIPLVSLVSNLTRETHRNAISIIRIIDSRNEHVDQIIKQD